MELIKEHKPPFNKLYCGREGEIYHKKAREVLCKTSMVIVGALYFEMKLRRTLNHIMDLEI
ncbi:hypothetical protein [Bacillus cereus]|uniref:hypothetical protein n=1 Tax=Bacillus cereus TaxID=1396 RepID=UPI003B7E499D